jgi:hypothetical protein
MSNYVPNYMKRRKALDKKEASLRRLVSQDAEKEKLVYAAEEVRLARTRVLFAGRHPRFRSRDEAKQWKDKIDAKMSALQTVSAAAILVEFGYAR